ncbi:hypothetical protein B0H10DRAFT_2188584 [Mycena sp. CBHHK59/15]|nr:hypothetical protein B0H10DRAFT_2188584 [Mycena sp. CBHHK59/15]
MDSKRSKRRGADGSPPMSKGVPPRIEEYIKTGPLEAQCTVIHEAVGGRSSAETKNHGLAIPFRQQITKDTLFCRGVKSCAGLDGRQMNFAKIESHERPRAVERGPDSANYLSTPMLKPLIRIDIHKVVAGSATLGRLLSKMKTSLWRIQVCSLWLSGGDGGVDPSASSTPARRDPQGVARPPYRCEEDRVVTSKEIQTSKHSSMAINVLTGQKLGFEAGQPKVLSGQKLGVSSTFGSMSGRKFSPNSAGNDFFTSNSSSTPTLWPGESDRKLHSVKRCPTVAPKKILTGKVGSAGKNPDASKTSQEGSCKKIERWALGAER